MNLCSWTEQRNQSTVLYDERLQEHGFQTQSLISASQFRNLAEWTRWEPGIVFLTVYPVSAMKNEVLTRCFTFAESFLNAIPPRRLKSRSIFSPARSSSVTPAGCEMMRWTCDTCLRERRKPPAHASSAARNVNAFWQLHSRCSTWQQVPNFAISSFTFSSELFTHQGLGWGEWDPGPGSAQKAIKCPRCFGKCQRL